MGLPLQKPVFDRVAYLAWEAEQPEKHEYLCGETFAMVGARRVHVKVAVALTALLHNHLRGSRCEVYASDMKLEVEAADAVFYPDVMVSCDASDRQRELTVRAPSLIIEILSPSTAGYDLTTKFAAYRQIPSLQEYLVVDADTRRLEVFRREPVGWVLHELAGDPATLHLSSVDLTLTAADAFSDLDEPPAA